MREERKRWQLYGLDELHFCATELIAWINDIYGVERDLSFHEPNLVVLTRQEQNCSWYDASRRSCW
jgi:hypothetical protein